MSGASSVVSSGSSAADDELRGPKGIEDGEALEDGHAIIPMVFGVLYSVLKERDTTSWLMVAAKLLLDFLQLFLIIVNPEYGYAIDGDSRAWRVVSLIQLNSFMADRGYNFYLAIMYLMSISLLCALGLCVWVGASFQAGKFDRVWPILVLRHYVQIFVFVLNITVITLFLIPMDCQYFGGDEATLRDNHVYANISCFSLPHLIHVAVAAGSLILFVLLGAAFTMADMHLNPLTRNVLAIAHSKVELLCFGIRVFLTLASVFVTLNKWLSVAYLVVTFYMMWTWIMWCPHTHHAMNYARTAVFSSIFYASIITFMLAYDFGVDTADAEAVSSYRRSCTTALWAGLVPAALAGAAAAYARARFFAVDVAGRFRSAPEGTRPRQMYAFTDAREVEIIARCCRVWLEPASASADETLDPDAVSLGERVIKTGLQLLPNSPFMIIWFSAFMIDVQGSYQSGYTQLQTAKKFSPSFLERYALFSREQQHTKRATNASDGENAADIVSYVEFQRNYRLASRTHKEALLAMRAFWQHLMRSQVKFATLAECAYKIETTVKQAERVYRQVMQRHTNSVKMLKLYARFLEVLKHNPWDAAKWMAEAERLELLEDEQKDDNGPGMEGTWSKGMLGGAGSGTMVDEPNQALVMINATGIIQAANKAAHTMFGYSKNELKLKNVKILMPEPFASKHTSYVRGYISAGKDDQSSSMLNRNIDLLGLHKERHVFGIVLQVTKVSGLGEDSTFMGLLSAPPPPPSTARMWLLPSGTIVAVDPGFTDWFGHKPDELAGASAELLAPESAQILKDLIARARSRPVNSLTAQRRASAAGGRPIAEAVGKSADSDGASGGADVSMPAPQGNSRARRASFTSYFLGGGFEGSVHRGARGGSSPLPPPVAALAAVLPITGTLRIRHKYNREDVEVEATVTTAGSPSHVILVFSLQLCKPEEMMMMVDRRGHLVHVTSPLATALGTTPKALMAANSAGQALEGILPHPLGATHMAAHLQDFDPYNIPDSSCRSGLPVALRASTPDGPELRYFRLSVSQQGAGTELMHCVKMKHCPLEEAMSSRRLLLRVDGGTGTITSIASPGTPTSLFGFPPSLLLGRHVSVCVDALRGEAAAGASPESSTGAGTWTLLELARRSFDSQGPVSVRVGVNPPMHESDFASMGPMVRVVMAKKTRSAAMSVRLRVPTKQDKDKAQRQQRVASATDPMLGYPDPTMGSSAPVVAAVAAAVTRVQPFLHAGAKLDDGEDAEESGRSRSRYISDLYYDADAGQGDEDVQVLAAQAALLDEAQRAVAQLGGRGAMLPGEGPELEVTLWRSDLLCAVLELSADGKVVAAPPHDHNPLQSASLLLGLPESMLVGTSIRSLLPLGNRPLTDLYEQQFGLIGGGFKAKKGLLKGSKPKPAAPGALNTARLHHFLDGRELALSVQAVPKAGSTSTMHLVMRPQLPAVTGRTDLRQYLAAAPTAAAALAAARPVPSMSPLNRTSGDSSTNPDVNVNLTLSGMAPKLRVSLDRSALGRKSNGGINGGAMEGGQIEGNGAYGSPNGNGNSPGVGFMKASFTAEVRGAQVQRASLGAIHEEGAGRISDADEGDRLSTPDKDDVAAARERRLKVGNWVNSGGKDFLGEMASVKAEPGAHGSAQGSEPSVETPPGSDQKSVSDWSEPEAVQKGAAAGGGAGEKHVSGDAASANSDIEDEAGAMAMFAGDYRRGKRFKKLTKMMAGSQATAPIKSYKMHYAATMAALLIANVAAFVVVELLVNAQRTRVQDLYSTAMSCKRIFEILLDIRAAEMSIAYAAANISRPLFDAADVPGTMTDLEEMIDWFRELHRGVYLGFESQRSLPTDFGLKSLWDDPSINVTNFMALEANGNVTLVSNTTLMGLWDAGNQYLKAALNVRQNLEKWSGANVTRKTETEPDLRFLYDNGAFDIFDAYLTTVYDFGELTIRASKDVTFVQLLLLVLEGCVISVLAVLYVWVQSQRIANHRYRLYSMFMVIPQGLTRTLANMSVVLDPDDEDEDVAGAGEGGDGGAGGGGAAAGDGLFDDARSGGRPSASGAGGSSMTKVALGVGAGDPTQPGGLWGTVRSWFVAPTVTFSGKRKLVPSHMAQAWLVSPFIMWAVVMLITNAVSRVQLEATAVPIATLNLVNTVVLRFHRTLYMALQTATQETAEGKDFYRAHLHDEYWLWVKEYKAMVSGGQAVNDSSPHFAEATMGVIGSSSTGMDILYYTSDCLCEDQADCQPTDSPYYKITRNGLDVLLKAFFAAIEAIIKTTDDYTTVDEPNFTMVWTLGQTDVESGIMTMSMAYLDYVDQVFKSRITMHVGIFAMSWVAAALTLLLVLLPFLRRVAAESKRIAEMLSQLPPEVDVEGLVARTLNGTGMNNSNNTPSQQGASVAPAPAGLGAGTFKAQDTSHRRGNAGAPGGERGTKTLGFSGLVEKAGPSLGAASIKVVSV